MLAGRKDGCVDGGTHDCFDGTDPKERGVESRDIFLEPVGASCVCLRAREVKISHCHHHLESFRFPVCNHKTSGMLQKDEGKGRKRNPQFRFSSHPPDPEPETNPY